MKNTSDEQKNLDLWNVPLKKGKDILKFEEGTYKILFKDDGEKIESKFGEQVRLFIEGWDVTNEETFNGYWFISISEFEDSLYGQLQRYRGEKPLTGRMITLQVTGSSNGKRYKILELKE